VSGVPLACRLALGRILESHLKAAIPAHIIGMIGVTLPKQESTLLTVEGEISPSFAVEFAQVHEGAGFDMALVGYSSSSAEGFLVAIYAAVPSGDATRIVASPLQTLPRQLVVRDL
jgi:alkanesulfonate monooxygenase